jgi:hypothetical protein
MLEHRRGAFRNRHAVGDQLQPKVNLNHMREQLAQHRMVFDQYDSGDGHDVRYFSREWGDNARESAK